MSEIQKPLDAEISPAAQPTNPTVPKKNAGSGDPLHGMTLERILTELVDYFGWETMAERIKIRCFTHDPSIKSSLAFLRKTPWARQKVENMYLFSSRERARKAREK